MIMVQFSFDVPKGKIQKFLDYADSTLRKAWVGRDCRSYACYRVSAKKVRGDQVIAKNRVVEQLGFGSMEGVRRFFDVKSFGPKQKAMADSYGKLFKVTNVRSVILEKV
jgi:hypothetical protein